MLKKILREALDYLIVLVVSIVIATLISTQLFTISQVQQRSMEKTLIAKDAIFVKKVTLFFNEPKRGEIVVLLQGLEVKNTFFGRIDRFYHDMINKIKKQQNEHRLVKRVIGLPGDEIVISGGEVYVNGVALVEPYVTSETTPDQVVQVPEGQIFVLGDNRAVSQDSRAFGCVPLDNVEGIAVFRIYPFSKIGKIDKQ